MISEDQIQLKSKAEFYKAAKELNSKILEARKEKKSSRVLTKLVKEGSFDLIEGAENYQKICFLVEEATRLKIGEKNKDFAKLKQIHKEVTQTVEEIDSEFEKGMDKRKAREYIKKLMELRVNVPRFDQLKQTLEEDQVDTPTKVKKFIPVGMSLEEFGKLVESDIEKNEDLNKTTKKKLIQNKDVLSEFVEEFTQQAEATLEEFDHDKVSNWMTVLKKIKIQIEGLEPLKLRFGVFSDLSFINRKLFKRGHMEIEGETPIDKVKRGLEGVLDNGLTDRAYKDVITRIRNIAVILEENDWSNDTFSEIIDLLPAVEWTQIAQCSLRRKKTKSSIFDKLVETAPESVKTHEFYQKIVSKNEGRDIVFNETDIHSKVEQFLDEDFFVELRDKIDKFIEDCQKEEINEKSNKILGLLKNILEFYTSETYVEVDRIVEEMFIHKLYDTKTFKKLEKMQKTIENMNKHRGQIIANKTKLKRSYKNLMIKKTNPLSILKNISRLNIQSAKKILKQFSNLQPGVQNLYKTNIEELETDIETAVEFGNTMKEFRKKYPLSKLNEGVSGKKLETLIKDFETLIHDYCQISFSTVSITKEIDAISWLIKTLCLIDGKTYYNCDRTLASWKKVYSHIEGGKGKVVKAVKKKIDLAHNFEKQVREIKSSLGKNRNEGGKKLSLNEARKNLERIEVECSEINFGNLKIYFEGVIAGIQSRLNSIKKDDQMMLHELQNHLEFFKRAPLEMDKQIKPLVEIEAKANQFLQMVRQLSPETFVNEQKSLQGQYKDLGIKVMEWEDMTSSVEKEEEILKEITSNLEVGMVNLGQCSQLRDKYKTFIKFMADLKLETGLMISYLMLLKTEFERKQESIEPQDEKACIDFIVLSALVTEIEQLTFRLKTNPHSYKEQLQVLNEYAQFTTDLFNDVKRHLEFNVFGVDLPTLDSSPPSKIFKSFVDITGPILDYKINLQIQEREIKEKQKSLFPYRDSQRKTALVLESKLEPPTRDSMPYNPKTAVASKPKPEKKKEQTKKRRFNKQPDILQNKPPVSRTEVTQELRNYYWKNWKSLMEQNEHLDISGLDALMASKSLEKAIYDRIKRSPLDYDVLCTSITSTLRHIVGLRNISEHLRNEAFKPNVLLLYCDKPLVHLRSLDRNFKGGGNSRNDSSKYDRRNTSGPNYPHKGNKTPTGGKAAQVYGYPKTTEVETSTVEEISYKHYKVYHGKINFEIASNRRKSLDKIDLISCSSYESIVKFSQIPRKVNLKTSVSQNDFAKFISYIINNPKKYHLLTGWVSYSKGHKNAAKYFKKNGCVASNQYSKTCKIFIFPIEALDSRWLTQIPIYTTTSNIEMLFMLVHKRKSGAGVEAMITPEPQPILTPNAYRIIPGHANITLKPSNLDRIKERTRITITGRFDDTPHRYSDRSAQKGPIKPPSKLQNLLDRAGEIEKVPEELIEQENKLRERKALQIDEGYPGNKNYYEEGIVGSFKKEQVSLGMDTLLRKRPVAPPRNSYLEGENQDPGFGIGAIDKNEFIKNAVNSIQLPPSHTFLGGGASNPINGFGGGNSGDAYNGNVF